MSRQAHPLMNLDFETSLNGRGGGDSTDLTGILNNSTLLSPWYVLVSTRLNLQNSSCISFAGIITASRLSTLTYAAGMSMYICEYKTHQPI